jgi:hypothetical protein
VLVLLACWRGALIKDQRGKYSLSRAQLLFWYFLLCVAYYFAVVVNSALPGVPDVPGTLLVILGISSITFLVSTQMEKGLKLVALHSKGEWNSGFFQDVAGDFVGISLYRVQFLAITGLSGAWFLRRVWQLKAMPNVPFALPATLALSSAIFLISKWQMTPTPIEDEFLAAKVEERRPDEVTARSLLPRVSIPEWMSRRGLFAAVCAAALAPLLIEAWQYPLSAWSTLLLWAGAFFMSGAILGFLFGVPHATILSDEPQDMGHKRPEIRKDTNLETVSDWLTKIFIGAALINLKNIPGKMSEIAAYVATGLPGEHKEPFTMAIIIYFTLAGFLAAFIGVRAYFRLQASPVGAETLTRVTERLTEQVESLFLGPVLDNYDGFVCAHVSTRDGVALISDEKGLLPIGIQVGGLVTVWFQANRPDAAFSEPVKIQDGRNASRINFDVLIDSDTLKFENGRKSMVVEHKAPSERLPFQFESPQQSGTHTVWVQVFQKGRLIQVVTVALRVKGDE